MKDKNRTEQVRKQMAELNSLLQNPELTEIQREDIRDAMSAILLGLQFEEAADAFPDPPPSQKPT